MQDVLTAAIEMHRSGQLGAASQLYQRVLAREQGNAEALHLLGVLHHQQGNNARAIELIGRAVAIKPNSHIYHANLAEAYRALGDFERAAGCCRAALSIWADYPEALCNLGAALQGLGKSAEAVEHLERALVLRPSFVVAHSNLGIALRDLGRKDDALEHFRRAVELDPAFAPAQTNLGQTLQDLGNAEEALPHCLECHSVPSAAPVAMLTVYGSANGFGWKPSEIIGAQIISVPLSVPVAIANRAYHQLLVILISALVATMLALDAGVYWLVVRPLKIISQTADKVSKGENGVEPLAVKGKDEIASVTASFNRMQLSLVKALRMLDE